MYNECMLNIVNKSRYNDLNDYYPYLEEYYQKTLEVLQIEDNYVLSLIICGPITIKRINRDYRNKDAVTDVISFALLDNEDAVEYEDRIELGDIFINRQRVFSQAKEIRLFLTSNLKYSSTIDVRSLFFLASKKDLSPATKAEPLSFKRLNPLCG